MRKYAFRGFRPSRENEKRLQLAQRLGLNLSEVVNESLELHFESYLNRKAEKIKAALAEAGR